MDKFKKWMGKMGYCDIYIHPRIHNKTLYGFGGLENSDFDFPKQMLTGYMIEYLLIKGKMSWLRFGKWLHEEMHDERFTEKGVEFDNPMAAIFDILKRKIEESK